jgi:hypothetical protein
MFLNPLFDKSFFERKNASNSYNSDAVTVLETNVDVIDCVSKVAGGSAHAVTNNACMIEAATTSSSYYSALRHVDGTLYASDSIFLNGELINRPTSLLTEASVRDDLLCPPFLTSNDSIFKHRPQTLFEIPFDSMEPIVSKVAGGSANVFQNNTCMIEATTASNSYYSALRHVDGTLYESDSTYVLPVQFQNGKSN